MKMLTVNEAAEATGISERYLRDLLVAGRVKGAVRHGGPRRGFWLIPAGRTGKPSIDRKDRRLKAARGQR